MDYFLFYSTIFHFFVFLTYILGNFGGLYQTFYYSVTSAFLVFIYKSSFLFSVLFQSIQFLFYEHSIFSWLSQAIIIFLKFPLYTALSALDSFVCLYDYFYPPFHIGGFT